MKRILPVCFSLCLSLGCSGANSQDKVIREQNDSNRATAAALAKANSLEEATGILKEYTRQRKTALVEAKNRNFLPRLMAETSTTETEINEALDAFHQRLKSDKANPRVLIQTSEGPIKVELYEKLAPITVKSFLAYVDNKFYDGTIFHRVIPTFMIQGGGFEPGMKKEKPTRAPIPNESYNLLANDRGTVAMARTSDPDSATAQFFINVTDNSFLNKGDPKSDGYGYAVFGAVTDGMDVVDKIRSVPTGVHGRFENVPVKDVIIESIRRVEGKK